MLKKTIHKITTCGKLLMAAALSLASGLGFQSCTDDISLIEEETNNSFTIEGDCIGFTIQLEHSLASRDMNIRNGVEDKDNWIDTQDKFRVLFFTEDGDFLFGANDRVVGTLENTGMSSKYDYWYVRIPMSVLVDYDQKVYDVAKIKNYLKTHKFKVAVLANWPNKDEKVNPGDYDDSPGINGDDSNSNFKDNPTVTLKGEPIWGWENSVLNEEAVKNGKSNIRNINDLHHIFNDSFYYDNTGDHPKRPIYQAIMGSYTDHENQTYEGMGEPTQWVKMKDINEDGGWKANYSINSNVSEFSSKITANQWIRQNWNPDYELNEAKGIYRHYQHLWFLWNFDAIYRMGQYMAGNGRYATDAQRKAQAQEYYGPNLGWNDGCTEAVNNPWGWEWWKRNGETIYSKMSTSSMGDIETSTGAANEAAFFKFRAGTGSRVISQNGLYGIYIPKLTNPTNNDYAQYGTAEGNSHGYFHFIARTSGTLRVKLAAYGNSAAKIRIQKEGSKDKEYTIPAGGVYEVDESLASTFAGSTSQGFRDLSIGEDSKEIYIYSLNNPVVVYGIEYVRGKYLYDTDREGIYPTEQQGIPMYGVKTFDPIRDWEVGTTHNLDGNISLIRALAKVELYIPKWFGERPSHVYMRSMNQAARCEPMDVETDTDKLWDSSANAHKSYSEGNCEWYDVQRHGVSYLMDNTKGVTTNYLPWLRWFFGSWKSANWVKSGWTYNTTEGRWIPGSHTGWTFSNQTVNSESGGSHPNGNCSHYPRIFNPYINRSDFCSMLYVGESGSNYKYVLYMPDKNIDDPTSVDDLTSSPKLPHIEYRFPVAGSFGESVTEDNKHPEFNLDDHYCYRVYFADYATNTTLAQTKPSGFDETGIGYEYHTEHTSKHWPVMRNHVYQFFVKSDGHGAVDVDARVLDWNYEQIVVDW